MFPHGYGMYGMGFGMWIGWLLIVIVIVAVVVTVVVLTGRSGGRGVAPPQAQRSRAREVLEERYARGEISTTEYRERADELERGTRT